MVKFTKLVLNISAFIGAIGILSGCSSLQEMAASQTEVPTSNQQY